MSIFGVILVRIFPAFSRIRTEYGEILRISPYSVRTAGRCWKNADQNNSEYGHFLRSDSIFSAEVLTVFFTTFDHFYHLPIVDRLIFN